MLSWPKWITSSEISIILRIIREPNSIIVLLFIQNISQQTLPPRRLFDLFLGTVSGYKPIFFSLRCSSKRRQHPSNNMFWVFFPFFRSVFVRNSAILSSYSLNSTFFNSLLPKQLRFQVNIPSINFVSNQVYHRIDAT